MMSPKKVVEDSGRIDRSDAPSLHWRGFVPDGDPSPAMLIFVHGLAEHFGRYGFPVDFFTQRGFPCYGLDLRGHGLSEGKRVHIWRFQNYLDDVDALVELARSRHPSLDVVLVGHSMGGVVALFYALQQSHKLRGLVLSSPGLRVHPDSEPPAALLFFGRIASVVCPTLSFSSRLNARLVSRDPEVVERYREDPLVTSKVTARWATEFLGAQKRSLETAPDLDLPVLAMQSGSDRLVDPAATEEWAQGLTHPLSRFQPWPGLFHEMFNEPERQDVFEHLEGWLEELLRAESKG